ncbi:methyltransferase-like protein 22 [Pelodytes ibericus]
MEVATFIDRLMSDVHLHTPQDKHLMVRLNDDGQPVFQSQFKILWRNDEIELTADEIQHKKDVVVTEKHCNKSVLLDDDGDLDVTRRPSSPNAKGKPHCSRDVVFPRILTIGVGEHNEINQDISSRTNDVIKIEHVMATTLDDVGKQMWRGALILGDYILWKKELFRGCTVLELGAGTGFTSIIMATVAKMVYSTDIGEDLLKMCENNVALNRCLTEPSGGEVKVKELNWFKNEFCSDPKGLFYWTEQEITNLCEETTVILAADVFYDNDRTEALFNTLSRLTHMLSHSCTIYLSIERRLNFTLRHMDITCDAYNHFQHCLSNFENINNGKQKLITRQISPTFPQYFIYERTDHLELWEILIVPVK